MTDAFLLSGAGNDFIALVEPETLPSETTIAAWCRRGVSVGADGLFVLRRQATSGDPSGRPRVRMTYWNADGGRSDLCLNGSRCATRLAFDLGWARDRLTLVTDVGPLDGRRVDARQVAVGLPPIVRTPVARVLALPDERPTAGWQVEVGVPHFVVPWARSLAEAPVTTLGPRLRRHPELGAPGANVHFVRFDGPSTLEIRSFERGVEAETLACGTGVVAAVTAGLAEGVLELPVTGQTAGGFALTVDGNETNLEGEDDLALRDVSLAGDARVLARCRLAEGAAAMPTPAQWRS